MDSMDSMGRTIAILTALDLEYEAVREHLSRVEVVTHDKGTRWELGTVPDGSCRVAIADVGKGNRSSATLAERTIAQFDPLALLFVGVAGTPRTDLEIGDVVVAKRVYAYQGGTSEDDDFRSRPRAWDTPHWLDQLAGDMKRSGDWTGLLRTEAGVKAPQVHRAPVAAGEIVMKSRESVDAIRLRDSFNDSAAVEMEGAGVAEAAHLNAYDSIVIRGISDPGDATKEGCDRAGSQQLAAQRAAAFAITLASRAAREHPERRPAAEGDGRVGRHAGGSSAGSAPADGHGHGQPAGQHAGQAGGTPTFSNVAHSHARIGIQAGQIMGDAYIGQSGPERSLDVEQELKNLRLALEEAYRSGRIDDETHESAQAELTAATQACPSGDEQPGRRFELALKRLKGLLEDVADFGAKITTLLTGIGRLR